MLRTNRVTQTNKQTKKQKQAMKKLFYEMPCFSTGHQSVVQEFVTEKNKKISDGLLKRKSCVAFRTSKNQKHFVMVEPPLADNFCTRTLSHDLSHIQSTILLTSQSGRRM